MLSWWELNALTSIFDYVVQSNQWYTMWDLVQDEMLRGIHPKFEEGPFIFKNIYLKWKDPMTLKFNPFIMWLVFSSSYFTWDEIVKLAIIVSCTGLEVWKAFNEKQWMQLCTNVSFWCYVNKLCNLWQLTKMLLWLRAIQKALEVFCLLFFRVV